MPRLSGEYNPDQDGIGLYYKLDKPIAELFAPKVVVTAPPLPVITPEELSKLKVIYEEVTVVPVEIPKEVYKPTVITKETIRTIYVALPPPEATLSEWWGVTKRMLSLYYGKLLWKLKALKWW